MLAYKPICKPNQLTIGTGNVVVATGWTVAKHIVNKLQPSSYAAIGHLYSAGRGIDLLIRNLLANPQVRTVYALAATGADFNAGSCRCLADFFKHGFTRGLTDSGTEAWVINSPVRGYIGLDIPEAELDALRSCVLCTLFSSVADLLAEFDKPSTTTDQPWRSEPLLLPPQQVDTTDTVSRPAYGHVVYGRTVAETWLHVLHRIRTLGVLRPTGYDGAWQELIDLTAVVTDEPDDFVMPEYLPVSRSFLNDYVSQVLDDAPARPGVKYTYGQRLRSWFGVDQIKQCIAKLVAEPDAASAVMSLWDVSDHDRGGSPCLNHVWLRIVNGKLSLTATFRSNDMFSAWPANAFGLRKLQQHICTELARQGLTTELGPLITVSQSAHIYDDCFANADSLLSQLRKLTDVYYDPTGNFVVTWSYHGIRVEHTDCDTGELLQVFKHHRAKQLLNQIANACPAMTAAHALYLGRELALAEQLRERYVQDMT